MSVVLVSHKKRNVDAVFVIFLIMKTKLNKTQAKERIERFFSKGNFSPDELKKIRRVAMKFNIKLGGKRKLFCKKCFNPISGKLSITKTHKTVECKFCKFKNKVRLS